MKRFLFGLNLWTGLLMMLAKGTFTLAGVSGSTAELVHAYAWNCVIANVFIMTALQGIAPGGSDIKLPGVKTTALAVLAFFVMVFVLPVMAQAQTAPATGTATIGTPVANVAKAPAYLDQSACTINQCTSWFVGAGISGNGTNADILGQGINQSVFAAGGIFDAHVGADLWNGKYYAGVEGGIGYQFQSGPLSIGKSNLVGYQEFRLGGSLTGLINGAGAQSAVTVPTALANALMAPYLVFGALERNGYSQWLSGAGAKFLLATNWDLYLEYLYGAGVGTAPAVNIVKAGLNRHFSL